MAGGFKVLLHLLLVLLGDFTAGEDAAIGRETLPENSLRTRRKKYGYRYVYRHLNDMYEYIYIYVYIYV